MGALRQSSRRTISELLSGGKYESAKIRVEQIIRDDFMMESMEIVELYCELLLGRFALFDQHKPTNECEPSLIEPVATIVYSAPRMNIHELLQLRDGLGSRFGKEFITNVSENKFHQVNSRVIQKLSIYAPDPFLVEQYLKEIAKFYEIPWTFDTFNTTEELIDNESNHSQVSPVHITLNPPTQNGSPDFDSLAKRFEALKKRSP